MSLLSLLIFSWFSSFIQPVGGSEIDRAKYRFTQAWVWQYQNDWITEGEAGHSGEMVVYRDSVNNVWLFNKEAYGGSGEGFDFILGDAEGRYLFCFRDGNGKKRKTISSVSEIAASRRDDSVIKEEFDAYNKATGATKLFGGLTPGQPAIKGEEFRMEYLQTKEVSLRFFADTDQDFQPIVYFNFIDGDVKLPFHFPTDIPLGKLLLEDRTVYPDGRQILIRLKEIKESDYRIDLGGYR